MGFQNSATGPDLGFYAARSYSLMRPPRTGLALDALPGQVRDRVIWPRRAELQLFGDVAAALREHGSGNA